MDLQDLVADAHKIGSTPAGLQSNSLFVLVHDRTLESFFLVKDTYTQVFAVYIPKNTASYTAKAFLFYHLQLQGI